MAVEGALGEELDGALIVIVGSPGCPSEIRSPAETTNALFLTSTSACAAMVDIAAAMIIKFLNNMVFVMDR